MKTIEKILDILAKNLGYTIVLVAAIILFAVFSDGLLNGIITAASALIGYACIVQLGREYRKGGTPTAKPQPTKQPAAKKSAKKKK